MSFNINEFSAQINRTGLSKNNLFFVRISLPSSLKFIENDSIQARELVLYTKTANIPNFDLQFVDIKNYGIGQAEKRPSDFQYQPFTTIFMMDSNFKIMQLFHRWLQFIINYNEDAGKFSKDSSGKFPFEMSYKENYAAVIDVIIYSGNDGDKIYTYKFQNAYPLNIGQVDVSWENQAEIMTLPVSFAYDKMSVTGAELGVVSSQINDVNGPLTYLSSINSYAQAITSTKRPRDIQDLVNQSVSVNTIFNSL